MHTHRKIRAARGLAEPLTRRGVLHVAAAGELLPSRGRHPLSRSTEPPATHFAAGSSRPTIALSRRQARRMWRTPTARMLSSSWSARRPLRSRRILP